MADRVVLAYSGGLDSSVGIGWLRAATGKDVVALTVDLGQGGEDLDVVRQRALDCGAVEAVVVDAKDEFADRHVVPALRANALQRGRSPLVTALARPLVAEHLTAAAGSSARTPWRTAARARATTRCASRPRSPRSPPD